MYDIVVVVVVVERYNRETIKERIMEIKRSEIRDRIDR